MWWSEQNPWKVLWIWTLNPLQLFYIIYCALIFYNKDKIIKAGFCSFCYTELIISIIWLLRWTGTDTEDSKGGLFVSVVWLKTEDDVKILTFHQFICSETAFTFKPPQTACPCNTRWHTHTDKVAIPPQWAATVYSSVSIKVTESHQRLETVRAVSSSSTYLQTPPPHTHSIFSYRFVCNPNKGVSYSSMSLQCVYICVSLCCVFPGT